jgi:adenosylmethionine-8-amino-7-oxononanoate aminotransferase
MEVATEVVTGQGVWLRPFRDLIYTMPPYVCGDEDLAAITAAIVAAAGKA